MASKEDTELLGKALGGDILDALNTDGKNVIISGNKKYTGVVAIDGKYACEKCKSVKAAKSVMHMDGRDTYTWVYKCECGNHMHVETKRAGISKAYWR